jgi:nicotinate phosphoribosyltransferase
MAFENERQSFVALQRLMGENTVFLLDTYDTIEGARLAAELGKPIWGVRLDSGDLLTLSREVRQILDSAGLQSAKIFASNDLDEHRVDQLVRNGAPIDAFGVGTALATSSDAPSLSAVYKLVELKRKGTVHYTAKFSDEKNTRPGAKQIYRLADSDILALQTECSDTFGSSPLIRPIVINGDPVESGPGIVDMRSYAQTSVAALPSELRDLDHSVPYRVEVSERLEALTDSLRNHYHA